MLLQKGELCKKYGKIFLGYENLYQISNLGNVYSLKAKKILKTSISYKGYIVVSLFKNKKSHTNQIHRLIAQAFIPNPNNYPQINHIDGNKQNNNIKNLEWCNQSYNIKEAYRLNLMPRVRKGSFAKGHHRNSTTAINQYDLQGNFLKKWNSITEASNQFKSISNNPLTNISGVLRNKRKTAFGYIWRYVK